MRGPWLRSSLGALRFTLWMWTVDHAGSSSPAVTGRTYRGDVAPEIELPDMLANPVPDAVAYPVKTDSCRGLF